MRLGSGSRAASQAKRTVRSSRRFRYRYPTSRSSRAQQLQQQFFTRFAPPPISRDSASAQTAPATTNSASAAGSQPALPGLLGLGSGSAPTGIGQLLGLP